VAQKSFSYYIEEPYSQRENIKKKTLRFRRIVLKIAKKKIKTI